MGYNSLIFMMNDAMGTVDEDPKGWWKRAKEAISQKSRKLKSRVEFGFGNHANGFEAAHCQHADITAVIFVGGNYTTTFGCIYDGGKGHHETDQQVEILKKILNEKGYDVIKLPTSVELINKLGKP